jgi:hypothetical protein
LWNQELTLFFATQLALERLGGSPMCPLADRQRSQYDLAFTAAELAERRRKYRILWRLNRVLSILLLPVTIPLTLLKWAVITILHVVSKLGRLASGALGSGRRPSAPSAS